MLVAVFVAAMVFHFGATISNWRVPFLAGHEFRQSQTALITYYIDRENNFSLLYEQPIFGKPWVSLLLEVPFYEWAVVGLSRATGWPHYVAARTISLGSFYLALPALYLLLGRLRLSPVQRLLPLAFVLTCPVYIFYSRAFLIDPMTFAACAWFLAAFVRAMDERSVGWWCVTALAGSLAALIKSAMFAVWLLPGAAYGAWCLWRAWQEQRSWRVVGVAAAWGLSAVVLPLALLRWWIGLTDPIKAAHASAHIFTAANLSQGNWGLLDFKALVGPDLWRSLLARWSEAITLPWLLAALWMAGVAVARSSTGRVLALAVASFFLLPQLLMPFAYAYQDYYFYSCAVFLVAGSGVLLWSTSIWLRWGLAVVTLAGLGQAYWSGYRAEQTLVKTGGAAFTEWIRDRTARDSVIVVAGADWAAMIPYYSERRALMIRNGLEYDGAYLRRAFSELGGEEVSAVILQGNVRRSEEFVRLFSEWFEMDPIPTLTHDIADVYLSRRYHGRLAEELAAEPRYAGLQLNPAALTRPARMRLASEAIRGARELAVISPEPIEAEFEFGVRAGLFEGAAGLNAHPDCEVLIRMPADRVEIQWEFGISADAYSRHGERTNGVQMVIYTGDGRTSKEIYRRLLDPVNRPADRGLQRAKFHYTGRAGDILRFASRANGNKAFDWAFWKSISVR